MGARSLRGAAAIVGVGQTPYYKRGTAPEPEGALCLRAIEAAAIDASIDVRDIDGFVSYGSERNSGPSLTAALGTRELRWSTMVWGGGGGGIPGALALAAAAVATGQAEMVAVVRAMAESGGERLRNAVSGDHIGTQYRRNGITSAAQIHALRTQRLLEFDGVPPETLRAVSRASYHHAQRNPHAQGYGRDISDSDYASARWISEPFRLYDCSRENDAGVAVLVTNADRARDLRTDPSFILAAPMGTPGGWGEIDESVAPYTSAGFGSVAPRLWAEAGYGPEDVDVAQIYSNFTGPAVMALIDHGFCTRETAGAVLTFENLIAPDGALPINTSGGDLADGFLHGMGLITEAVHQLRGTSVNQVPGAQLSLVTGGPVSRLVSSALLGTAATL
jgi:hypothetical protein